MKAYVTTTGALFSLLVLVHIWRAIAEGAPMYQNLFYILVTVACAALAAWAWLLRSKLPGA
jgi:hypothetical protein